MADGYHGLPTGGVAGEPDGRDRIGQHETMRVSNKPHDRLRLSATNRARP